MVLQRCRRSRSQMFLKIRNIHRKIPVLESLFNKVSGLQDLQLYLKRLQHIFSREYCKIFKNSFFDAAPPVAASNNIFVASLLLFQLFCEMQSISYHWSINPFPVTGLFLYPLVFWYVEWVQKETSGIKWFNKCRFFSWLS